jgi:putative transposase
LNRRGLPGAIRSDNGPEFTSRHFLAWALERGIELIHIQPGRPTQNGRVTEIGGIYGPIRFARALMSAMW